MNTFNIIIMTHGDFGKEIVKSSEMIIGKSDYLYTLSLEIGMSPETYINNIKKLISTLTTPSLVLVDLFGGTPANVALMMSQMESIKIVSGLNLGMLIESIMKRQYEEDVDLDKLADTLVRIGKDSCRRVAMAKGENDE